MNIPIIYIDAKIILQMNDFKNPIIYTIPDSDINTIYKYKQRIIKYRNYGFKLQISVIK